MKLIKFSLLFATLMLAACGNDTRPQLAFEKEELTGIACCKTKFNRLTSQNKLVHAELVLKNCASSKNIASEKRVVNVIFNTIYMNQKDYTNAKEEIVFNIDGADYPVKTLSKLNRPETYIEQRSMYLGGQMMNFGSEKQQTTKTVMLALPYTTLTKLAFSISSELNIMRDGKLVSKFKFAPQNTKIMRDFKEQCLDQQPIVKK